MMRSVEPDYRVKVPTDGEVADYLPPTMLIAETVYIESCWFTGTFVVEDITIDRSKPGLIVTRYSLLILDKQAWG